MSSRDDTMKRTKTHPTPPPPQDTDFSYPPSIANIMDASKPSRSQSTQGTDPCSSSARSSSLKSSTSSAVQHHVRLMDQSQEHREIQFQPLADNPYCFEESEEEDEEEEQQQIREEKKSTKKSKKKKKKKKHESKERSGKEKRRHSNESSDKQSSKSSRRTRDSSDSHRKSASSDRHSASRRTMDSSGHRSRERKKELEPLEEAVVSSPRKTSRRLSEPSRAASDSDRKEELRRKSDSKVKDSLMSPQKMRREHTRVGESAEDKLVSPRKERRERHERRRSTVGDTDAMADSVVSPRKERRERKKQVGESTTESIASPRKERRGRHGRRESDDDHFMIETSDEFLRKRRERHERMKTEAVEVETLQRRERRERRERRKEYGLEQHDSRHYASSVGASRRRHHHSGSARRHHSDGYIPHDQSQVDRALASDVNRAAASPGLPYGRSKQLSSKSAELWSSRPSQAMQIPATIEVPATIDVPSGLTEQQQEPPRKSKLRHGNSDYYRLMKLMNEQSEGHETNLKDDVDLSERRANAVGKLHPLIAATDDEFQEAFDNLARDSVFDENFEKAFNEFSEHYLALSPWGEDDSLKDKCDKTDTQDFIPIPLTPVSRKGITSYISKDPTSGNVSKVYNVKSDDDSIPRTPAIERGILFANAIERIHDDDEKKKEAEHDREEFVEVSRTPYYRKESSNKLAESPEDDGKANDKVGNETMSQAHSEPLPANQTRSEPSPESSEGSRRNKWGILRGRRQKSKATV